MSLSKRVLLYSTLHRASLQIDGLIRCSKLDSSQLVHDETATDAVLEPNSMGLYTYIHT